MKFVEIYAVVLGGNPLYRRSWSVELVELVADPRFGGRLYRQTCTGPVWYDSLDDARLDLIEHLARSVHSTFDLAWQSACRANQVNGLPLGQEVAWN